jgi:CheY-like chemotaxis protein
MKKILVVDDDRVMLRLFQLQVRRSNCEGFFFSDAQSALEWLKSNTPDLAVLDYTLPLISGMQLSQQMRELNQGKKTPIIFVTGTADPAALAEIEGVPDSHVLAKPFSPRRLQTLIEGCLA